MTPTTDNDPQRSDAFTATTESIDTDLDPQLQRVLLQQRSGTRPEHAFGNAEDTARLFVDVLAVVKDPSAGVPGLETGRVLGDVVTGRVLIENIEAVRTNANVVSLKAARAVKPELHTSVPEIRATRELLTAHLPPGTAFDGQGVIVGIVDFGCDFVHTDFRRADGTSRLLFLWDQNDRFGGAPPQGFQYGRELAAAAINAALQTTDPYAALRHDPGDAAHGTHVMGIAAGNGRGSGAPGVAPGADLIFVQLAANDLGVEDSFGNSRRLLEAVDYIFAKAATLGKPAVVNLSLGTHGGPHDGSTPAERGMDFLLQTPGRAIVISAGNSFEKRGHASGRLSAGDIATLRWEKFASDTTGNELEIWYTGSGALEVSMVSPTGQRVGPVRLGERSLLTMHGGEVGRVIHRKDDSLNHDNHVDIILESTVPAGIWTVELKGAGPVVGYHAWIERDDDRNSGLQRNQSRFIAAGSDAGFTLGSISCGRRTIAVGSYKATVPGRDLSDFSAQGPTRDGREKPEVSAPGDQIFAARSRSETGTTPMWGTSMAAPHVTGLIALMLQAGGRTLTNDAIRAALIAAARRDPPASAGWHARYGYGRIDAPAAIAAVLGQPQALAPRPAANERPAVAVTADSSLVNQLVALLGNGHPQRRLRLHVELEIAPANEVRPSP